MLMLASAITTGRTREQRGRRMTFQRKKITEAKERGKVVTDKSKTMEQQVHIVYSCIKQYQGEDLIGRGLEKF